MAGLYIPPHGRMGPVRRPWDHFEDEVAITPARAPAAPKPTPPVPHDGGLYSLREIHGYFWPDQPLRSNACKTLHDTAAAPGVLGYMLLLHQANPRLHDDCIVFVKDNLDLLPAAIGDQDQGQPQPRPHRQTPPGTALAPTAEGVSSTNNTTTSIVLTTANDEPQTHNVNCDQTDTTARNTNNSPTPIAVFAQVRSFPHQGSALNDRSFAFEGWHSISRLAILQPHSAELMRMLDQKFQVPSVSDEIRDALRSRDDWQAGFIKKWAVIKLQREEDVHRAASNIVRLAVEGETGEVHVSYAGPPKRTVNEMLTKVQFGDRLEQLSAHHERLDQQHEVKKSTDVAS
ncbi:hypothetical protein LTR10_019227 [Elasticomyces elasticus]|uniref:Uncharacterized protein n=1 Tax=Exophiala sideris TaxID=1016849 RepID=A0ABR0JPE0_9EURO|nr:hypothetical protein LTR10_019227 [Elasticomyces elasticus]KAK5038092.1 hypothetical protein LTS07_001560 [Exophiala sideris]KAK5044075.1 hypothetical protein LTR13_000431 [Exophiala sideris]KAK5067575.1 hypothetical protein LTR69_001564 [Exophiala sideris]KAK5184186.1 hypothetical protein LTR44_003692 [Eurotiomycetes sp. CCFEE 6388]